MLKILIMSDIKFVYIGLPYNPAIPPLGINENTNLHKNTYINAHSNVIHNSQKAKQPKCPSVDEGLKQNVA